MSSLDPSDDLAVAYLRSKVEGLRNGRALRGGPLYNDAIDDEHFSPTGAEVWARAVGGRVILLLECDRAGRVGPPGAAGAPAAGIDRSPPR